MTDNSFHLQKIAESANSILSRKFAFQGIFTNAVLLKPDITTLIQDADPEEQALFTLDSNSHFKAEIEDNREWSFETLCEALRKLSKIYNIQNLEDKLKFYEMKWNRLNNNILRYEDVVEDRRKRLSSLTSSLEHRDFEMETTAERVDALIQQHQQDILRIETEIKIKHQEIEILQARMD